MNKKSGRRHYLFVSLLALIITSVSYFSNLYAASVSDNDSTVPPTLQLTPVSDQSAVPVANTVSAPNTPNTLFPPASPIQQQAFQNVTRGAMPMTPDEIKQFRDMLAVTKQAASATPGTPPKPVLSVIPVSLSPGSNPPVIRLQEGFVTSVLFTDNTGTPWPVDSYDLGNSSAFNIQWQPGSNMLMIQAMSMYTYGNMGIHLKGLPTPIMITLVPGQQEVDYRADLQVDQPRSGAPSGLQSLLDNQKNFSPVNTTLLTILNGITPAGATVLNSSDPDCVAWALKKRMYIRTRLTLLSPGWISVMKNSDGTKAYEMGKTASIIVSKYGEPTTINFEGLTDDQL